MTFKLISLAASLESVDELHEARLLILLKAAEGRAKTGKSVGGIMKLAKMDFLLRYPNILERALRAIADSKMRATAELKKISEQDRNTIESRMIRFRYGPWDKRYRRWLAVLVAKDLALVVKEGKTVRIMLTPKGRTFAEKLGHMPEFEGLFERARLVQFAVGDMPSEKLKNFVYQIAPEILTMKWGESISL